MVVVVGRCDGDEKPQAGAAGLSSRPRGRRAASQPGSQTRDRAFIPDSTTTRNNDEIAKEES